MVVDLYLTIAVNKNLLEAITLTHRSTRNLTQLGSKGLQISLIWLITVIVFWPTFANGFQMEWDDQWMLINHELILNPTWENIRYYFFHYVDGQYFPLNQLYYVLLFQINGFDPFVFHLGSLIIHLLNIGLVFGLLARITKRFSREENFPCGIVLLATTLFAIHPLQVEAVAWISASKVLLYGFFTLSALLWYWKYLDTSKYQYMLAVLVCYLLGFMCKEQMIILPLLLVLFDFFFGKKNLSFRRLMIEKIPFFVLALTLWYYAARSGMGMLDAESYPWYQRLAMGSYCYFTYWFRFIAPMGLLHFYDFPIVVGESLPAFYYGYVLLGAYLLYVMYDLWIKGKFLLVFSLSFTVMTLALVLHMVPSPRTYMAADRFVYLPIIGMGLLVSWLIFRLKDLFIMVKSGHIIASAIAVTILFGILSFGHTRNWSDSVSLKKEVREYLEQKKALGE